MGLTTTSFYFIPRPVPGCNLRPVVCSRISINSLQLQKNEQRLSLEVAVNMLTSTQTYPTQKLSTVQLDVVPNVSMCTAKFTSLHRCWPSVTCHMRCATKMEYSNSTPEANRAVLPGCLQQQTGNTDSPILKFAVILLNKYIKKNCYCFLTSGAAVQSQCCYYSRYFLIPKRSRSALCPFWNEEFELIKILENLGA